MKSLLISYLKFKYYLSRCTVVINVNRTSISNDNDASYLTNIFFHFIQLHFVSRIIYAVL